jgi:hypothetical protein
LEGYRSKAALVEALRRLGVTSDKRDDVSKEKLDTLLQNIKLWNERVDDVEESRVMFEELNNTLDNLLCEDFFGTEGQCDPRRDRRDER